MALRNKFPPGAAKKNQAPQIPWNVIARGEELDVKTGAKRGGLTQHLSGLHLIPNVGREAMVPAECVRRQRPVRKPVAEVPKPPVKPELTAKEKRRFEKAMQQKQKTRRSPSRERRRSRSPSIRRSPSPLADRQHRPRSSSPAADAVERDCSRSPGRNVRRSPSPHGGSRATASTEEPRRLEKTSAQAEEVRQEREVEEDRKRLAIEEERKLQELQETKKKQKELAEVRKKRLGGAFAFGEDDVDPMKAKERAALEREIARKKAVERQKPASSISDDGNGPLALSGRSAAAGSAPPTVTENSSLTAADIDGRHHDHKFSKVWQDWDATKKDNPGEVARQFMKIAAIKQRGHRRNPGDDDPRPREREQRAAPRNSPPRGRSRSRSRRRR